MQRLKGLILGERPSPLELVVGPEEHARELWRGGLFYVVILVGSTAIAISLPGPGVADLQIGPIAAIVVFGIFNVGVVALLGGNAPPEAFTAMVLVLGPLVMVAVWLAGPNMAMSAAVIPSIVGSMLLFHRRRAALIGTAEVFVAYAIILAVDDGYARPVARWILVAGFTAASAVLMEWVFRQLRELSDRDKAQSHELREAHAQLAQANALLEGRVTEQVNEIERLGQLRRFLTPQIAESVLSGDADSLLATHRKRIAVFFCDLRGFTRFSASAEPEDIAEVLTEYYDTLGRAIEAHNATIGGFAGDGVWAFFNDPFPVEDPAGKAFAMALSLREPLRAMRATWERRGFNLGYGLGIAYGYATMSTIGFESRSEYTAVGTVVNLGARLCDAAGPGELLVDARAYNELPQDVAGEPTQLMLKGFNDPVSAYRIAL